ncbi:hypothetical protein BC828DRAFT_401384 [Blastocladiella britannica]|nr:hypothetical protein BC828DRAFT_401384 [Blastocladiella britannica]
MNDKLISSILTISTATETLGPPQDRGQGRPTSRGRAAAAAAAAVAATATATPAGDLAMSDRKTMLVHAPPVMDFAQGDATLPTRIPCYSRHHKEKVGFVVEFELRDVHGRAIARGESPPILITDDHKMTKKSIAAKAAAAGEAADVAPSVQTKAPGAAAKTARGTKRSRSGEPIEAVAPVDSAEPSPVTSTVTLPSTSASPPATAAVAHDQPPAMTSMQSAWTMLGLPALPPPIGSSAADLSRRASDSSFSSNGEMTAPQPPADMLRSVMYLPGVPMGSPGAGSAAVSLTGTWATSVDAPPLRASQAPASVAPLRLEDMLRSPALHDAEDHHPQLLQQQPPPTPITPHDTASQSWMNIDTLLFGGSLSAPPSDEGISTSAGETDDDQSPRPKRQRGQHGQVVVPVSPESTGSSSQHDMDLFDASLFHFVPTASAPMVMPSSCRQSPTSEEVHPQPTTVSPQMLLNLPHQGLAQQLQAHEMATPFLPPPAMPPFYSTSHTSPGHMPLGALGHPVAAPNMSASSLFASSTGPNAQPIPLAQFLQAAAALSGQAVSLPTSLAPAALASSVSQQQQHMPLMMAHQQQQLQMQHQLQLQQYQGRAGSSWLPKVDRIVPAEGPLQGGTEVTVLGRSQD